MERKEKAWKRRGLFVLVSNRRPESPPAPDDPLFPAGDEHMPSPEDVEDFP